MMMRMKSGGRIIGHALVAVSVFALAGPAFAAKKKPAAKPAPTKPAEPAPKPAEPAKPADPAKTTEIKAAPAKQETAAKPDPAAAPKEVKDDLDFDLLGDAPNAAMKPEDKAKQEEIEKAGKTRRAVLQAHTALGFTLLGVMTVNTLLGTLNYYDKFGGGGFTNNFEIAHLVSSMTTTGVFLAQAGLGIFAPDPYPKPGRWDTGRFHRIFMTAAAIGMAAQIVLGFVSASRYGHLDQRDLARAHLAIGYITYGFTAAGAIAWLF